MNSQSGSAALLRRQRVGRFNRVLGYVVLPLLVLATAAYYLGAVDDQVQDVTHAALLPLFFLHVALSFYVYGVVRPRRTLRVFHIYFGYVTFVVVMLSQAGFTHGHARAFWTVLMYVTIAVHIVIGLRYGVARRRPEVAQRHVARST